MRNLPEYLIAYQAIHLLGGVAVCLNAFSDGDTLAFCVNDVSCRALICDPERFARLQAVYPDLNKGKAGSVAGIAVTARVGAGFAEKSERSWEGGRAGPKVFGWEELDAKHKPTLPKGPPQAEVDPDDDCIIVRPGMPFSSRGRALTLCSCSRAAQLRAPRASSALSAPTSRASCSPRTALPAHSCAEACRRRRRPTPRSTTCRRRRLCASRSSTRPASTRA
jgi:hypothetical protein